MIWMGNLSAMSTSLEDGGRLGFGSNQAGKERQVSDMPLGRKVHFHKQERSIRQQHAGALMLLTLSVNLLHTGNYQRTPKVSRS